MVLKLWSPDQQQLHLEALLEMKLSGRPTWNSKSEALEWWVAGGGAA